MIIANIERVYLPVGAQKTVMTDSNKNLTDVLIHLHFV